SFLPLLAVFFPFFEPGPIPCFLRTASFASARALDVPFGLVVQIAPLFINARMFSRVIESATSSSLSGSNLTLFAPMSNILAISSLFFLMFTTITLSLHLFLFLLSLPIICQHLVFLYAYSRPSRLFQSFFSFQLCDLI